MGPSKGENGYLWMENGYLELRVELLKGEKGYLVREESRVEPYVDV